MSSFQGVGIEEFHCIQRCPHFNSTGWCYTNNVQRYYLSGSDQYLLMNNCLLFLLVLGPTNSSACSNNFEKIYKN